MTALAIDVTITRTELALAALDLEDVASGYEVVSLGLGQVNFRRQTATSPFVAGEQLVAAVKDTRSHNLTVRVKGPTHGDFQTRLGVLLRAMEQFSYTLSATIGGVTNSYSCMPADYTIGDGESLNKFQLMVKQQDVRFVVPSFPIPTTGGL